jgi:hypothetical protein
MSVMVGWGRGSGGGVGFGGVGFAAVVFFCWVGFCFPMVGGFGGWKSVL